MTSVATDGQSPQEARNSRLVPTAVRIVLVVVGLLVIGGATWFAASWIDPGYDNTCGSLFQPGLWTDTRGCTPVMPLRLVTVVLATGVGLVFAVAGAAGPRWVKHRPGRAGAFAACAVTAMVVLLVVNESVRSDGLWNH